MRYQYTENLRNLCILGNNQVNYAGTCARTDEGDENRCDWFSHFGNEEESQDHAVSHSTVK